MGMFCLNMMRIALELARENLAYESLATKFFQHYVYIGAAMKKMGSLGYQLWDEEDGFFYDVLRYPDGRYHKFRVRSLVGLIPLFAVERLEEQDRPTGGDGRPEGTEPSPGSGLRHSRILPPAAIAEGCSDTADPIRPKTSGLHSRVLL